MRAAAHNPWAARFAPLLDQEEIRRRAAVFPQPMLGLFQLPVEVAYRRLETALQELFYPSQQCVELLSKWVGMAYAHCLEIYSDEKAFLQHINAPEPPLPNFFFPHCFTGLPGTGKTKLLNTLHRILPPPAEIVVGSGYPPVPSQSSWAISIDTCTAPSDLLIPFAGGKERPKNLTEICRKLAYRNGVAIFTADEFQHATTSTSANAQVTKMLMSVAYLGLPYVYGANYSLVERLMRRPHEDRQRLLAHFDVLLPDPPESQDWSNMLAAQKGIAPDIFQFDPIEDALVIHGCSAGCKRAEKHLLLAGLRIGHQRKRPVTIDVLREAYSSQNYASYREEVEQLLQVSLEAWQHSGRKRRHRDDLKCPIDLPKETQAMLLEQTAKLRKTQVAAKMQESAMTPAEKALLKTAERQARKKSPKLQAIPAKRKQPLTAEELKNNSLWFKSKL
ncbi:MAG: hypothetical protein KIT42_14990 [Rhodocyclaceae bacterium]|nr:hypothetical protein [Rhodocyclaceae bacterium]MCW5597181.1 hypothetical protein [Rhodocyclaceae bacterium]